MIGHTDPSWVVLTASTQGCPVNSGVPLNINKMVEMTDSKREGEKPTGEREIPFIIFYGVKPVCH